MFEIVRNILEWYNSIFLIYLEQKYTNINNTDNKQSRIECLTESISIDVCNYGNKYT